MNTQEIQIRAKKISELDDFNRTIDDNTYLIVGYNNGAVKQNYKIALNGLISLIRENTSIDDSTLLGKINEFINSNQITIPTGAIGPQGPQGEPGNGSDVDLTDIQNQIDEINRFLDEKFDRNITYYNITCNLLYVRSNSSNVTTLAGNKSATLSFTPNAGYKMPLQISVIGCTYSYNSSNKSVTLSNPTSDIIINITGEIAEYLISYSFSNINYTITSNEKSSYRKDEIIELSLSPKTDYKLPTSISASGCTSSYVRHSDTSATLTLTCSGTGNMIVSGTATSTRLYYFGYLSKDDTSNINVTYDYYTNGQFKGLKSVTVLSTSKLTSSASCPFNTSSTLTFNNIGSEKDVILLVPTQYFNISTYEFINASNQRYKLYPAGAPIFAVSFPYYCTTSINGIQYYALLLQQQSNGASYIFK